MDASLLYNAKISLRSEIRIPDYEETKNQNFFSMTEMIWLECRNGSEDTSKITVLNMDVILNGLSISAEGELQLLCCMMEKNDVTSMSLFGC